LGITDIVSADSYLGPDANDDTAIATALASSANEVYLSARTYDNVLPVKFTSIATKPQKLRGAGREKAIIEYIPASYSVLNFAVWIGDSTNDTAGAYLAKYPELCDMSIRVGEFASGGLRVRECEGGKFSNLLIHALDTAKYPSRVAPGTDTNYYWGLMAESNLNCTYSDVDIDVGNGHQDATQLTTCLDLHQSRKLDPNGGNTGVSTITTTRFNNFYLHHAADAATITGQINCSFNHVVQEACSRGITVGANGYPMQFNDLYTEAITSHPITMGGLNATNRASAVFNGGFWNSAGEGTGLTAGDAFVYGTYIGQLKIKGMAIANSLAQSTLVQSTNSEKIEMDACPMHPILLPAAGVTTAGGAIITTSGSATFQLTHTAHGLAVGDVVGLQLFTTPYNGLSLNQPYYRIQAIVDADNYTLKSILLPGTTASGSGTQARNASEKIVVYPDNTWLNCLIQEPDKVKLTDCNTEELLFSETFGGATGQTNLLCNGQRSYIVDDWSYVMTAQGFSNETTSGMAATVGIDMPDGYETSFTLATLSTTYTDVTYSTNTLAQTAILNIGMKIPPGTMIRYKTDALAASILQGRIVIARTGIK